MALWITSVYEGSGTVLERLKATLSTDLPSLLKLIRGQKLLAYRYPLDRGVGNYIRALLDCYELDGDRQWLSRVESIVSGTIGPRDEIASRDLDNVEETWFYTIFLQAVINYLDIKRRLGEFDQGYRYARATLLHYARWMASNESPYLDFPERLQYPNDTWSAQDIRKACMRHPAGAGQLF